MNKVVTPAKAFKDKPEIAYSEWLEDEMNYLIADFNANMNSFVSVTKGNWYSYYWPSTVKSYGREGRNTLIWNFIAALRVAGWEVSYKYWQMGDIKVKA